MLHIYTHLQSLATGLHGRFIIVILIRYLLWSFIQMIMIWPVVKNDDYK